MQFSNFHVLTFFECVKVLIDVEWVVLPGEAVLNSGGPSTQKTDLNSVERDYNFKGWAVRAHDWLVGIDGKDLFRIDSEIRSRLSHI